MTRPDALPWSPPLLVAVAVSILVTLFIVSAAPQDGEVGEVLQVMRLADFGPGDEESAPFRVNGTYQRIGLSYHLDVGLHPRAAFVSPLGTRIDADYSGGEIDLEVLRPAEGRWSLTVWTPEEGTGLPPRIEGDFIVLGFGGPRPPP